MIHARIAFESERQRRGARAGLGAERAAKAQLARAQGQRRPLRQIRLEHVQGQPAQLQLEIRRQRCGRHAAVRLEPAAGIDRRVQLDVHRLGQVLADMRDAQIERREGKIGRRRDAAILESQVGGMQRQ